jgi:DNA-binding response OmpR family regulator
MARILVVEDTSALAQGLRSVLQLNGHVVRIEASGQSGLDAARADQPDLMLLDLMLPDLHGYDILRILRGEGYEMPVLVLTASGSEARQQSFDLGANGFLSKPFQLGQLLGEVETLLRDAPPVADPPAGGGRTH